MPRVEAMPELGAPQTVITQSPRMMIPQTTLEKPPEPEATEPKSEINAKTSPQDAMRIAAGIRKEAKLREREKALDERERQMQETNKAYDPWRSAAEKAKRNKLEALKDIGISYDELTNQMLNDGAVPPQVVAQQAAEQTADEKIAALRKELADERAKEQQTNYQQSIAHIDAEVQALADSSEKFVLVKESGMYHDVTKYIEEEYHRTKRIMPVSEALEKVNSDILTGLQDLLKNDGIRNLLLPPQEPKIEQPQVAQPNQKITRTLTNIATGSPPAARSLTSAERRARAIRVAQGLPPDA